MQGSLERARAALRSRDFLFLLGGRLSSQFADGFFQAYLIAQLVFLNPEEQGTALGVAKAYAILVIPFSLVGPLAGVLIDWWSRQRILMLTPLIRTASAAAMFALDTRSWPLLLLALLVVSTNRFFLSSANASTPSLVPDEDLLVANSMATIGGAGATLVGIVVGTKLAEPLGPGALPLIAALGWLVSALFVSRIRSPLKAARPPSTVGAEIRRMVGDLGRGVRRLRATPPALGSIVSVTLDQFLIGFVAVLSVVVFKEEFKEGIGSYGNIVAAGGVGVIAGTLTAGWLESRLSKPRIVAVAFALAGLAGLAAAPRLTDLSILLLSAAVGLTFAWRKVAIDTIVQESVPDRYRGRIFSIYDICYANARVLAALAAIPLIPALSTGWLVALVGVAYLAWTPVLPWWVRRRVPVTIRFYAGGRADEVPRSVVIGGEEQEVEVLGAWLEETDTHRRRRFLLRTPFGERLEVVSDGGRGRWMLEREMPVEVAGERTSFRPGGLA
jgi:MFS family permease